MIIIITQLFLVFFFILPVSYGTDTISANHSLTGDLTIISNSENFELGFFKPGNSSNNYIGIWYKKVSIRTIVWVANRETPISDRYSSELKIVDGNLVLLNESKVQIWSTNVTINSDSATAVIRDDGNLVLTDGSSSGNPVWQSFDHPVDTWLPGGKLAYNYMTKKSQLLTAWKSEENPAVGLYSLEVVPSSKEYISKRNGSQQYWTSGAWNGQIFSLVPEMSLNHEYNFSYHENENESYFTYSMYNPEVISRFVISVSGQVQMLTWSEETKQWNLFWNQPRRECEVYDLCGAFGTCRQNVMPFCYCLTGFTPRFESDWNQGDFSGGCVRKTDLQCGRNEEIFGFLMFNVTSPPPNSTVVVGSAGGCRTTCLNNCSCNGYSIANNECSIWDGELMNLSEAINGETIYIKVASKDLHLKKNSKLPVGTVAGSIAGVAFLGLLCSIGVIYYRMKRRDHGMLSEEDRKGLDVPFFEYKRILSATDNFSLANKLGQGGFGPVYKGMLPGGAEIAVKRLSSQSGQGLKEFKNEVLLIAKLQHRNLVRLLGYSMKDHEMMLLYEYMPNKSLDCFIFDKTHSNMSLDWSIRFDIIMGISRGLLYLHQDSRLRIIHRDMKASNVLLDEDMNPKISDFGLAKIVIGKDTEANTTRVIGTYGYMAPEYALDGLFSVKSDVFSFGVIVLEIISGKRNTGYYNNQQYFSLISYAWGLWKDKNPLDLLDPALAESCNSIEVLRCMIVGLLCIQEYPQDRPTMTDVLLMLGMDIDSLPDPKEPAFVSKTRDLSFQTSSSTSEINQLTITKEEGR